MRGNTFGKMLSITSFGESHGQALGVVVDGVPGGMTFSLDELQKQLDRRAPGRSKGVTSRKEGDQAIVLSGIYDGKTLGSPIAIIVNNENQRSKDYDKFQDSYRPGHADKTTLLKYGHRDHRGGGRSSGRETLARVIGGYFASLIIPHVFVRAYTKKLGPFHCENVPINLTDDFSPYGFANKEKNEEIEKYLLDLKSKGDSIGGQIAVVVRGCPGGLGEPAFDKLKADFAKACLSIGACVGFSYGLGENFSTLLGSQVTKEPNAFGGIEGGISNGEEIYMTLTIKPTSTVGQKAREGRHDPCIIPRVIPVVESMVKMVIADHYLRQKSYESK